MFSLLRGRNLYRNLHAYVVLIFLIEIVYYIIVVIHINVNSIAEQLRSNILWKSILGKTFRKTTWNIVSYTTARPSKIS
jgi:hypothetical protein